MRCALTRLARWAFGFAALAGGIGFATFLGADGVLADEHAPAKTPTGSVLESLKAHVEKLAGPEWKGRGAWEDRVKAADFIAGYLEALGCVPLPGQKSFFVDFGGTPEQPEGRNVCAWWGAQPKAGEPRPEYVMLTAHYDHLGVKDGVVYPGADDNASGVAVMLETVRTMIEQERLVLRLKPLARALCIVAFDLEEKHLIGSKRFAAEPPVPLEDCALFLTMDQMGRSIADLAPGTLFLMGSEHCRWLDDYLVAAKTAEGITKARIGIDFQPPTGYSDYVPFQERSKPFLFISTGACGHYHKPEDTPEKLDYARMEKHVDFVRSLVLAALDVMPPPAWRAEVEPRVEEIQIVHDLVAAAVPKLAEMNAPGGIQMAVTNFKEFLAKLIAKGSITVAERTTVRNTARMLFTQAVALVGKAPAVPR